MEELQLPPLHEIYEVANKAGMTYKQAEAMRSYAMQAVLAERAKERERCARICDAVDADEQKEPDYYGFAKECAAAIRKGE